MLLIEQPGDVSEVEQDSQDNATIEQVEEFGQLIREAVNRLLSRREPPTEDELKSLFEMVGRSPTLNFSEVYERHKERNTEEYQEVVKKARRLFATKSGMKV